MGRWRRSTVSRLWLKISGFASSTKSRDSKFPLKSGTSTSIAVFGLRWRTARMVAAQTFAPPSGRSSLATDVSTQCLSPILATASATLGGSAKSSSVGFPVWIAQKVQARVQILPRIIRVAVPRDQHSPILGHWALWQTVCNWLSSTRFLTLAYSGPEGSFARNQFGFPDLENELLIKIFELWVIPYSLYILLRALFFLQN